MAKTNYIRIDASDFIKGMSTSTEISDGGFAPTSIVNPIITPGVLYGPGTITDKSTNVTGRFIASCEDFAASSADDRYFVDDEGAYYSWNGTTITKEVTDANTTVYIDGRTDLAPYQGNFYATVTTDVTLWNGAATLDNDWWTNTKSKTALSTGVPHPLLVFENILWIGDGQYLHNVNNTTANYNVLQLESNEVIQALGIDPGSGLMLISVSVGQNASTTQFKTNKVLIYDGYSNKPRRSVIVDERISAFYSVGGVTYVTYGKNLGYWNGSGITFLRKLSDVSYSNTSLPTRHRMTNIDNTLYVADGQYLLAFGEILKGQKVFYYLMNNNTDMSLITHLGQGVIGYAYTTDKFYTLNTTVKTINAYLRSNYFSFDKIVDIKEITIEFGDNVSNNVSPVSCTIEGLNGENNQITFKNITGSTTRTLKSFYQGPPLQSFFISIAQGSGAVGIKRVLIEIMPAE